MEHERISCPQCGSQQLIVHRNSRMIYINHDGERIPLLTANFRLNRPVLEEHATVYTCPCSWAGNAGELDIKG